MQEIFKDIQGYDGKYKIGNYGTVISYKRISAITIKPYINKKGYSTTGLCNKTKKTIRTHQLVAKTFIPNQENKPSINHIDGNKLNNKVSNLEWCSHSENSKHAFAIGLMTHIGEKNTRSKLTKKNVIDILLSTSTVKNIAKEHAVSVSAIYKIKSGLRWSHCS